MTTIKCAIYARYSSVNQKESSIEDQIAKCRKFARSRGWVVHEDHIYTDKAISGASIAPREGFQKLMVLAESGSSPFNYIIVDDTSRVARNLQEALLIFAKLRFKGIFVYYVSQGIDSAEKTAETMITVHGIVDSMFLSKLADGTHRGLKGRFEKGFSTGGKRYGFKSQPVYTGVLDRYGEKQIEGYKLSIDPDAAATLLRLFRLFGEKEYSAKHIANILNKELKLIGTPVPPKGRVWSASTIHRLIRNEAYRGHFVWNKTSVEINPETGRKKNVKKPIEEWIERECRDLQIIDNALWATCQKRISDIGSKSNGSYLHSRSLYSEHLLTRVCKCKCGSTFGIVSGGNSAKYGCTKNWNAGNAACSNSLKIKKAFLEEAIITTISRELLDGSVLENVCNEVELKLTDYVSGCLIETNRETIFVELAQVDQQIKNMIADIKEGNRSEFLRRELAITEKRRKDLLNQVNLRERTDDAITLFQLVTPQDLEEYFSRNVGELIIPETTLKALTDIVDSITVENVNNIYVDINIVEKIDNTTSYLLDLIQKRDGRIRLQTGSHLQPYTSRVFKARIVLSLEKDCNADVECRNVFYAGR